MNACRLSRAAVAAVGGLLGLAAFPIAVAGADPFDVASYTIDPVGPETVTGLYNITTAPPGVNESLQGYGQFDVLGNDSDDPVGHFSAYISTVPYLAYRVGTANEALVSSETLYVSPDVPDYEDPTGIAPTGGTVIDFTVYGFGFENLYTDLPGLGADGNSLITDTFSTPFGDYDLSWIYATLDASAGLTPAEGLASFADQPWLDLFDTVFGI